jgi:hypothetical protein
MRSLAIDDELWSALGVCANAGKMSRQEFIRGCIALGIKAAADADPAVDAYLRTKRNTETSAVFA